MNGASMSYQPKGGMCRTCSHAKRDCSTLPFGSMPVIERLGSVAIVRCTGRLRFLSVEM